MVKLLGRRLRSLPLRKSFERTIISQMSRNLWLSIHCDGLLVSFHFT